MSDLKKIRVALVGNPNAGKTTIFNELTGATQHVGNWGGVTVEVKEGTVRKADEEITVVDLPGTYSLSAFSIEERVARDYIVKERPEVVVNVVDATNLERSLYFTVQLMELGVFPILVLNMWDEVSQKGMDINIKQLSKLLKIPVIPTVGRKGIGIDKIIEEVVSFGDGGWRAPSILNFEEEVKNEILSLSKKIKKLPIDDHYSSDWLAIKLLESDSDVESLLNSVDGNDVVNDAEESRKRVLESLGDDADALISETRYGYASGAVRETVRVNNIRQRVDMSDRIDSVLTHRVWAYPIFFLFLWLLFQATFNLGAYPMLWIEMLFGGLSTIVETILPSGWFQSMIVDGVIAGVGGVAVFLPNILILFFGISIMEDTGYMARAAFIMDKFMHKIGLHGKSFIPMVMGMGCTVPAVMAARTLESPRDRIKTILLTPLISCSARMPVFVLFAGALFPKQAGNVVFLFQVVFGFVAFAVMAIVFKYTIFRKGEDVPFVMELPPYRVPTGKSVVIHMWHKAEHYIVKMGTVVLFFSVLLWFASEYPKSPDIESRFDSKIEALEESNFSSDSAYGKMVSTLNVQKNAAVKKETAIGKIGTVLEPLVIPFGSDWRGAVSLLTGFVAKEVVVSSMGVLYAVGDDEVESSKGLREELRKNFTPLSAVAFMFFVLLYTPCIVALTTIVRELDNWKWSLFSLGYQLGLAWGVAVAVFQVGRLLGF
jgi:ferrous iron transport protein B